MSWAGWHAWVPTRAAFRSNRTARIRPRSACNRKSATNRRIAFTVTYPSSDAHSLTLVTQTSGALSDIDAFVVLADPADATLVGAGDIASCTGTADSDTAAVAAGVPGIVFTAGDNVYPDGAAANYTNCYDPAWGGLKSRTKPDPGNHDYEHTPGATGYFGYFGAAAGDPTRPAGTSTTPAPGACMR